MSVLYCTVMYQVKYSAIVYWKVPIINGPMLGFNFFKNLLQAINDAFDKAVAKKSNIVKPLTLELF